MSSTAHPTPGLPHRTISNIRSGAIGHSPSSGAGPHTPTRGTGSALASPSGIRADDDIIVLELGTRFIRVGFAGDVTPTAVLSAGPAQQRRAGDFSSWLPQQNETRPSSMQLTEDWEKTREFWTSDLRATDLNLVQDSIDRALRLAFSKYMLVDSRPRRLSLVLPSLVPLPLLSAVLDALFGRFQVPNISLLASGVMSVIGAGVRSGIIVDLGWAETVVTSVYEYREILTTRSIRGAKMLVQEVHGLLAGALERHGDKKPTPVDGVTEKEPPVVSFDECEEVACRLVWCRRSTKPPFTDQSGLPTVEEQEETPETPKSEEIDKDDAPVRIDLASCDPPQAVEVAFRQLSDPCENTFISSQCTPASFDDNELPISQLIYQHLLALPVDARAVCMSRLIFTGGCASIPGLRQRLFDEVSFLIRERGWDPVCGKGAEQVKNNPKLSRNFAKAAGSDQSSFSQIGKKDGEETDGVWHDAANAGPVKDPVLGEHDPAKEAFQGQLRALSSLGPWSGASMISQLKTTAIASIDRDLWTSQGPGGASRVGEVDLKAQQRQSLGGGGLMRGASGSTSSSWTLGAWGFA